MGSLLSYEPEDDYEGATEDAPYDGQDKMVVCTEEVSTTRGGTPVSGRYTCSRRFEQDYSLLDRVLGTGKSGAVHLAESRASGQKFAVKSFKKGGLSSKHRQALKNEVELYLQLAHPHIAQLQMVYEAEDVLHLVMEFMEGGELYDRVSKEGRYTEEVAADVIHQALLAVAYLHHAKNIAHRDLKLENFLYERQDSSRIKLIDFGYAALSDSSTSMSQACGTVHYVAPEVLSKCYTVQADMWSVGVISYMVLTGMPLFHGSNGDILARIKHGKVRFCPHFATLSAEAQSFVSELLVRDPSRRLTAAQALEHPWIRGRDLRERSSIDVGILGCLKAFAGSSPFHRAALCRMAWSLSPEQQSELREQFLLMDVRKRGSIRLGELTAALQESLLRDGTKAEDICPWLDVNDCYDHDIEYNEFCAAALGGRVNSHDEFMRRTFANFDVRDECCIVVDELRAALEESFEGTDVEELIHAVGSSGDGRADYHEFIEFFQPQKNRIREPEIRDLNVVSEDRKTDSDVLDGVLVSVGGTIRKSFDPWHEPLPVVLGRVVEQDLERKPGENAD